LSSISFVRSQVMFKMPTVHYRDDAVNTANPYAIYTRKVLVDGREVLTDP